MEGLLRLPEDIRIEAIDSIIDDGVTGLGIRPGSIAILRPRTRNSPQVITGSTLDLVERFRQPSTIVDAVIDFARSHDERPEAVLEAAFPVLQTLVREGILVPEASVHSMPIDFLLREGDRVAEFTINSAVSLISDTEVYRATDPSGHWVAVKIARPGADRRVVATLMYEAKVLAELDARCAPRLAGVGRHDGRAYIATEWCDGVDIASAAGLAREREGGRPELVALARAVLDAFVELHRCGVVHGDIHPRNVLTAASDNVRLIDFGEAVVIGSNSRPRGRAAVDLYMEPELASARLRTQPTPPPTPASDQYSLAALLYLLLTGGPTHDFDLSPPRMLVQLRDEDPVAFSVRGVNGFDNTEQVLRRALLKDPGARYPSLAEFALALRTAFSADASSSTRGSVWAYRPITRDLLRSFLARVELEGPELDQPPRAPMASLNLGAAGTALALLTISQATADQDLLAAADAWAALSANVDGEAGLYCNELGLTADRVGTASLHHASPGVQLVSALVAHAQGDDDRLDAAISGYLRSPWLTEPRDEVGFGLAGLLVGCSLLFTTATSMTRQRREALTDFGDRLQERIGHFIPKSLTEPTAVVGTAHGLAGRLTAVMRWRLVTGRTLDPTLEEAVDTLARLGQPFGRGTVWPVSMHPPRTRAGMQATWCNGTAGLVHLWLAAAEALGDERLVDTAARAAWTAFEAPRGAADLCCGTAGRAYALLAMYRRAGDEEWLSRAKDLAQHAARHVASKSLRRNSLYRGEAGVAVLVTELDDPVRARMPAFEC